MVVCRSNISDFMIILIKMAKITSIITSIMTSHGVRNDELTILTRNKPRYQILSLINFTKGGIVVVCRSIISDFIGILRKITKNDVKTDILQKK